MMQKSSMELRANFCVRLKAKLLKKKKCFALEILSTAPDMEDMTQQILVDRHVFSHKSKPEKRLQETLLEKSSQLRLPQLSNLEGRLKSPVLTVLEELNALIKEDQERSSISMR